MPETAEVVIAGGGIVGCATAFFLAKEGVKVTLIEPDSIASCASGFAAGILNPLDGHGIPGPLEAFAQESFRMTAPLVEEVRGETGVDPKLRDISCLWVALREHEAEQFAGLYGLAQRLEGFPARWLDGREVLSLEPRVSPRVLEGMYLEGTTQIAAYEYTLGLAEAAEKKGATIRHGRVKGLKRANGRVSGVVLESGEVSCEKLVLAMGPWMSRAANWLDFPVPITPLKGQILRLEVDGPPLEHAVYRGGGGYISSKSDGLVWAGTTEEEVGFDDHPTPQARAEIMKGTLEVMPELEGARVALQTACLRPVAEDGLPIIGAAPGWEGVYLATGAGRKGILLGAGMAKATADLVMRGRTPLSTAPFSPARFMPQE